MRRLFIAVNLPSDIKSRVTQIITRIDTNIFPQKSASSQHKSTFRWLPPENWHLTLTFLGYQPDEAIEPIIKSIRETAQEHPNKLENVRISFEKIILAPPWRPVWPPKFFKEKLWRPRMIWLTGTKQTSKILGEIKDKLEDELVKNGVRFKRDKRPFNGHLTLARFQFNFGKSNLPKLDNIKEVGLPDIENLSFTAKSLDLMESRLKRTGAEYEILQSIDFVSQ